MQRYQPSNRIPTVGVVLIIPTVIIGSALLGWLFYVVGNFFYIPLASPAMLGFLCGGLLTIPVYVGKIRNPLVMGIIGIVFACLAYGSYFYFDYTLSFRRDLRDIVEEEFGYKITDQQAHLYENMFLLDDVGTTGFVGYLKSVAKMGVSFTFSQSHDEGKQIANLHGKSVYVYWLVEMLCAAFTAFIAGHSNIEKPFSEEANQWFGSAKKVGVIPPQAVGHLIRALQEGNYDKAGSYVFPPFVTRKPQFALFVRRTQSLADPAFLFIRDYTIPKHSQVLFDGVISSSDFSTLEMNMREVK